MAEAGADMSNVAPPIVFAHGEDQGAEEGLVRLGAVKPAITTSCRFAVLIFSQSAVRPPDAYALSAGFAMRPSRPFRSASAKNSFRALCDAG